MENVEFELVIISAHDLKSVSDFGRAMRTYANVWSDSSTLNSTKLDLHGGRYPTWNDKFRIHVSKGFLKENGSALSLQVFCKTLLGNKRVGSVRMPYADFFEGFAKPNSTQFLSYRISPRGTLDFSLRFLDRIDAFCPPPPFNIPSFPSNSFSTPPHNTPIAIHGCAIGLPLSHFSYPNNPNPYSYPYPYPYPYPSSFHK